MALAYLEYNGVQGGQHVFRYDIGSSSHFSIGLATEKIKSSKSRLDHLDGVFYDSPLKEAHPSTLGRGMIKIPANLSDERHQFAQLVSFRSRSRLGRAYSEVVRINKFNNQNANEKFSLPALGFTIDRTMRTQQIDRVHFEFSENKYSEDMFLEALLSGIGSILPKAIPLLGDLVGGLIQKSNASDSQENGAANAISQLLQDKEFMKIIQEAVTAQQEPVQANTNSLQKPVSPYSQAKVAPLALIPLIMPLLKNVINPEVMKTLINSPEKLLKTISDAALKVTDRELEHLEKINPGVDADNKMIENVLASMVLSIASNEMALKYKRIDSVKLMCSQMRSIELLGRKIAVYSKQKDLLIPVTVTTPKPFKKAILQVIIKDTTTLKVLCEKKIRVENVANGQEILVSFTKDEIEKLPENQDLTVCLSLVFKNSQNESIGAYKAQLLNLVDMYTAGAVLASTSAPIALNDTIEHRDFWHKVWEDSFKGETKEVLFQTKYYSRLNIDRPNNAQIETKILFNQSESMGVDREIHGKLKSGMELGLHSLNQLIPQISSFQMLNSQQLNALDNDEFAKQFDSVASTSLRVRGRAGDMAALWTFPELDLRQVVLKKAIDIDQYGQIVRFEDEVVHFPVLQSIHFVGVRSER